MDRFYTLFLIDDEEAVPAFEIIRFCNARAAGDAARERLRSDARYQSVEVCDGVSTFVVRRRPINPAVCAAAPAFQHA